MSYKRDYFRSKELDKREISKQDRVYMMLIEKVIDGKIGESLPNIDFSINKKEQIEYIIQSVYGL